MLFRQSPGAAATTFPASVSRQNLCAIVSAPLYVEMMGGAGKIMAKGQELHDQGKYLEATEILNKLVFAEPQNQIAKDLLADVYEQIG